MVRPVIGLLMLLTLTGCSAIPSWVMPSSKGVSVTPIGTQMAQEATQQAVGNQSNQEAGRDVVITETELEAVGERIFIDQDIEPWVLILLILGWLAPSPSEMGRGLMALLATFRRPKDDRQRTDGKTTLDASQYPFITNK
jgi:uncharacterized protein YceK